MGFPVKTKKRAEIMIRDPLPALCQNAPLGHADALARLTGELDAALATPADFPRRVRAALLAASKECGFLLTEQCESGAGTYRRHLLAADPDGRYAVAALVWEPGQASPVHGHQTWCAYAVIEGTLAETLFRWDPITNRAIETRTHAREAGSVSFVGAGRGAIHQLGNAPGSGRRAVSLHVYGVAATQIATHVNDLLTV
jgi:predicted metal-dependent enzyme (double-stranded beta helix superfamily)